MHPALERTLRVRTKPPGIDVETIQLKAVREEEKSDRTNAPELAPTFTLTNKHAETSPARPGPDFDSAANASLESVEHCPLTKALTFMLSFRLWATSHTQIHNILNESPPWKLEYYDSTVAGRRQLLMPVECGRLHWHHLKRNGSLLGSEQETHVDSEWYTHTYIWNLNDTKVYSVCTTLGVPSEARPGLQYHPQSDAQSDGARS